MNAKYACTVSTNDREMKIYKESLSGKVWRPLYFNPKIIPLLFMGGDTRDKGNFLSAISRGGNSGRCCLKRKRL